MLSVDAVALFCLVLVVLPVGKVRIDGKMDAPVVQRAFWCTLEGLVAIALLLGGGLSALQGAGARRYQPAFLSHWSYC